MVRPIYFLCAFFIQLQLLSNQALAQKTFQRGSTNLEGKLIDLSGTWSFQVDSLDKGLSNKWFTRQLPDKITLPGSMTTNWKGNDISLNTPWTGDIVDSSWFHKPEYAPYRKLGNIKVPFWLQPIKYYKGAAWYQKTVTIPKDWKGKQTEIFIERAHWETSVWVDTISIGLQNSLGTPHVYELGTILTPGTHRITIRVDNRIKDFNVGVNSHSISDHTQGNWNGMIGRLEIRNRPDLALQDIQIFPEINKKQIVARIAVQNNS
jgi:hypothetical protein